MTKQQRLLAFLALATLCALPVDAMAGGFGLFKRCHKKKATCCAPPACQPCPPVVTEYCSPCQEAKEPVVTECWKAIGTGTYQDDGTEAYGEITCYDGPNGSYGAIYELYNLSQTASRPWYLLSIQVVPAETCPCPSPAPQPPVAAKAQTLSVPGRWTGLLIVRNQGNGTPIFRAVGSAEEVIARLDRKNTQNFDVLRYILIPVR